MSAIFPHSSRGPGPPHPQPHLPTAPHSTEGAPHASPELSTGCISPGTLLWDTRDIPCSLLSCKSCVPSGDSSAFWSWVLPSVSAALPETWAPAEQRDGTYGAYISPMPLKFETSAIQNDCSVLLPPIPAPSVCDGRGTLLLRALLPAITAAPISGAEQCHVHVAQRSAGSRQLLRTTLGSNWKSPNILICSFNITILALLYTQFWIVFISNILSTAVAALHV